MLTWREVRVGGGGMLSGGPGTGIGEDGRGGNTAVALDGVVGVGALGSALLSVAEALRPADTPNASQQAWLTPKLQGKETLQTCKM